jgi:hypothetical protein
MTPLCRCTTCRAQFLGVDGIVFPNKNGRGGAKEKPRDMSRNSKAASCCRTPKEGVPRPLKLSWNPQSPPKKQKGGHNVPALEFPIIL